MRENKIISVLICFLVFNLTRIDAQVSNNRVDTYWAPRVVPIKQYRDSTWLSFWNKVTDGIPATISNVWSTSGQSVSPSAAFGSTNNASIRIKTNNINRFTFDSIGIFKTGILTYTDINIWSQFQGSNNNYYQSIWQNTNNGNKASVDLIVSNDLGTATTYYGNFGMNSSTFTGTPIFNRPNMIYLTGTTGDLGIGTTTNTSFYIGTNNAARFKIDSVGISRQYSTTATSTLNGSMWYDGGLSGNTGFNLFSDDPTNASYFFNFGNTTNHLRYYCDHGTNNWLTVKAGSNLSFSIDDATTVNYQILASNHIFTTKASTVSIGTSVYKFNSAAHTNQTASTEANVFNYGPSSMQFATGALARERCFNLGQLTISFTSTSTVTDGADMYIAGGLVAGSNASITNNSALLLGGMTGTASLGAGTTNGYALTAYAPTGATNNYAARFLQGNVGIGTSAPAFTLDVSGNARITSTLTVGGLAGTTTNDNASAGNVGQSVTALLAVGSAVSFTTATAVNILTISLTAGDWDVEANLNFNETTSTVTSRKASISSTSATQSSDGSEGYNGVQSTVTSEINTITLPNKRISISGTTTIYLVGTTVFSAGTCTGFGTLTARRVR